MSYFNARQQTFNFLFYHFYIFFIMLNFICWDRFVVVVNQPLKLAIETKGSSGKEIRVFP